MKMLFKSLRNENRDRRGCDRMVVGFTTNAISA